MLDFVAEAAIDGRHSDRVGGSAIFWAAKRVFDLTCALMLLPLLGLFALVLLVVNPFFNRGPLFYLQDRMGQGCRKIRTIKFRSMTCAPKIERGHDDPIEIDRITPLGRLIRKARIDELPQILNVLKGEMSMIGPRPDYWEHAKVYLREIPEYKERHVVRPGITGLAQVELGYVEGCNGTRSKALMDLHYVRNAGFRLDSKIVLRTLQVILKMGGA